MENLVVSQEKLRSAVEDDDSDSGTDEVTAAVRVAVVTAVATPVTPRVESSPARLAASGKSPDAKVAQLRELLGVTVRSQSEQANELAAARTALAQGHSAAMGKTAQSTRDQTALREAEDLVKSLSGQLSSLQLGAQARETAANVRIAELESRCAASLYLSIYPSIYLSIRWVNPSSSDLGSRRLYIPAARLNSLGEPVRP